MDPILKQEINHLINQHNIIIFIKGCKDKPQCGFSNMVVQIMNNLSIPYYAVNVLDNIKIREGIKEHSNWPTIPQIYINGNFVGGADIILEQYQSKELHQMLEVIKGSS